MDLSCGLDLRATCRDQTTTSDSHSSLSGIKRQRRPVVCCGPPKVPRHAQSGFTSQRRKSHARKRKMMILGMTDSESRYQLSEHRNLAAAHAGSGASTASIRSPSKEWELLEGRTDPRKAVDIGAMKHFQGCHSGNGELSCMESQHSELNHPFSIISSDLIPR